MQKVLQPLYFAREDTRTPFRYALVAMVINAVLAVGLAPFIGYLAAAVATSAAGWSMVWLLWHGSREMGEAARPDARFLQRAGRIFLASLVMGAVLLALAHLLAPMFATAGWRYLALAVLVGTGMVAYFASGWALGALRLTDLKSALKR